MSTGVGSSKRRMRREDVPTGNWANLPTDILGLILTMLETLTDYCRFGAVCRSWYTAAQEDRQNRMAVDNHNQLPMLIVPSDDDSEMTRALYNPITNTRLNVTVEVGYSWRCCGSSHGWLIIVNLMTLAFSLTNPFSGRFIELPVLMENVIDVDADENEGKHWYSEYYIVKAVLSGDPSSCPNDFAVIVIYGLASRLALYVSGDQTWTLLSPEYQDFDDIIFYQGWFYAVDHFSMLYSIDIDDPEPVQIASHPPHGDILTARKYLVESPEGNLLQIWRLNGDGPYFLTYGFMVFKLLEDISDEPEPTSPLTWEPIWSLSGWTVFLGDSHGLSVMACDFPGCAPNSIYYTGECGDIYRLRLPYKPNVPGDVGVYHFDDSNITLHYQPSPEEVRMSPPIWIIPTLGLRRRWS